MPTTAIATFGAGRVDPIKGSYPPLVENINLAAGTFVGGQLVGEVLATPGTYGKYASAVVANQVSAVQTVTIAGTPTGGTFTLRYLDQETIPIAFNAAVAAVVAALVALPAVGAGGVTGTGGPGPGTPYVLTFAAGLANQAVALLGADSSGLTGGAGVSVTSVMTTAGTNGVPVDGTQLPTHILQYSCVVDGSGNITLGTAPSGGGEWNQTSKGIPAYRGGEFSCADLTGLDANVIALRRAVLVQGTLSVGRIMWLGV